MRRISRHFSLCLLFIALFSSRLMAQLPGAGFCIGLNGSGMYAQANHPTVYNIDGSLTMEAWFNPYTLGDHTLLSTFGLNLFGAPHGYALKVTATGAMMLQTPAGNISTPANAIYANDWFHVAVACAPDSLRFYVNGLKVHAAAPPTFTAGVIPFRIGATSHPSSPAFFNGELDEIRMWNATLSATDIQTWMCRKLNPSHPANANLVGYWRMDDSTGAVLSDLSPQLNNANCPATPMWGWSGAPIGDHSTYSLSAPFSLSLPSAFGDTLRLDNVSGGASAVHLYLVNQAPNWHAAPPGYSALDTTHYFGIFYVGGAPPLGQGFYGFGANPFFNGYGPCQATPAVRSAGNLQYWSAGIATPHPSLDRVTFSNYPRLQLIPGRRDNPYYIIALPDSVACQGDTLQMGSASGAGSYQWFLGGNPIAGATTNVHSSATAGTYTLQATTGGCTYTSNALTLTFNAPPQVSFNPPAHYCLDSPFDTLPGVSPSGGTLLGPGINGVHFDPLAAGVGAHILGYTVVDPAGCSTTAMATVTVHATPQASIAPFAPLCQLDPPLTLSSGQPAGGTYLGWGITGNVFDPSLAGPGNWAIDYVYADAFGCDDTASATLTVYPAPVQPTISGAGNTLSSSSLTGNQWYDQNGPIAGATGPTYTPTATGTYYVVVTDGNGCESEPSAGWPFLFVGRDAGAMAAPSVSPNPARDHVRVSWAHTGAAPEPVTLRDLTGRVLLHAEPQGDAVLIDLGSMAPGVYLLEWGSGATRSAQRLLLSR